VFKPQHNFRKIEIPHREGKRRAGVVHVSGFDAYGARNVQDSGPDVMHASCAWRYYESRLEEREMGL
jgi:hypothetical protein